jgi:hypothetical protein
MRTGRNTDMRTREELAREAGCLDLVVSRPGPDGRVAIGPVAEMPVLAFSTGTTEGNLTGGWKSVRPLYQDKRPPCQEGCPAGEDGPATSGRSSAGNTMKAGA